VAGSYHAERTERDYSDVIERMLLACETLWLQVQAAISHHYIPTEPTETIFRSNS
jgi:hypothetical protein